MPRARRTSASLAAVLTLTAALLAGQAHAQRAPTVPGCRVDAECAGSPDQVCLQGTCVLAGTQPCVTDDDCLDFDTPEVCVRSDPAAPGFCQLAPDDTGSTPDDAISSGAASMRAVPVRGQALAEGPDVPPRDMSERPDADTGCQTAGHTGGAAPLAGPAAAALLLAIGALLARRGPGPLAPPSGEC